MTKGGFPKKTIAGVPLDGATVLVRADYNVPLAKDGSIKDDYRLRASLPTLRALLSRGCTVVIISHLGRPEGKPVKKYSLEPVAERLSKLLNRQVTFVPACVGDAVSVATKKARKGSVLLLENLRFHAEEEANDAQFAARLAADSHASYFVQDGFGVAHRAHASTDAIAHALPSVAGLLLEKEYVTLTSAMQAPKRPMVAVLGGAKISDKIELVERFVDIADKVVVGGAMANNFLQYRHFPVGKSLVETGVDTIIQSIYTAVEAKVGKDNVDDFLVIPEDVAVAKSLETTERRVIVDRRDVGVDELILDIGPTTIAHIDREVANAKTVVWNGTLGYAELPQFAHGSARLALALATHPDITSVIGGGDTADFVLHWDAENGGSFTHVSTGGGASLELMAGRSMPGVEALMDA